MFKFEPPISVKNLADVTAGSFIRWDDRIGICVVPANAPQEHRQNGVVIYQPEASIFVYETGSWPNVLAFETGLEILPDLDSFDAAASIDAQQPVGALYFDAGKPFVALAVGRSALRFVDLSTGQMRAPSSWGIVPCFRSWKVVVRNSSGNAHTLLEVGPWNADADEDLEPDVS